MTIVAIVVESKYGNTAKVAEAIAKGLNESGIEDVTISRIREADISQIARADIILIGSPNHVGGPTRSVRKLIRRMSTSDLTNKQVAFFDTYMGKDIGKAVRKMEAETSSRGPKTRVLTSGLSLRVEGMKGPLAEGELEKAVEFGKSISAAAKSD